MSSCHYIRVSSYYYTCVLILPCMCPHMTICPHNTCVLILLCVLTLCVLVLLLVLILHMCPHTSICVLILLHMCPDTSSLRSGPHTVLIRQDGKVSLEDLSQTIEQLEDGDEVTRAADHLHSVFNKIANDDGFLYMCPHTTIYVSSYDYMCSHTTICVSSYYYMCPHNTTICVRIHIYVVLSHTTVYVS